uniref:Large ribosomal subunit protein eL21 n=1 Tax=Ignisphaera aggregans TaxID=334771 RepID=A0A7C4JK73_9CREN
MVKASQGLRHKTRRIMRKNVREKGAIPPLSRILIPYRVGDKVHIVVDPAIHGGIPHRRYIGKSGIITGFKGRAMVVDVEVGSKVKRLFLLPEHVKPAFDVSERIDIIIQKLKKLDSIRNMQKKQMLSILLTRK